MRPGPSRFAERLVAFFLPTACREDVLGDLHERWRFPSQYALDAFLTVPVVIFSKMRRTADPQVLLINASALYLSFLGAAWLTDGGILQDRWGLLRPAIAAAAVLAGVLIDDAYADPGRRPRPMNVTRGPLLGVVAAVVLEGFFWISNSGLALSPWILFYGCGMSLLLSAAVRMSFPRFPKPKH